MIAMINNPAVEVLPPSMKSSMPLCLSCLNRPLCQKQSSLTKYPNIPMRKRSDSVLNTKV